MKETKKEKRQRLPVDYDGKWMSFKIPLELHTNLRVDAFRQNKNMDKTVIEYLQLGFDSKHKTNK